MISRTIFPSIPTSPQALPSRQRVTCLVWSSWLQHGMPHAGSSDFQASLTFWVCHELQPRRCDQGTNPSGSVWNMATDLFAVIYGGNGARLGTLLWLLFTSPHRNDGACLTHGGGNYSIMAHREFCCWHQEFLRANLKACFNKEDELLARERRKVAQQIFFIRMESVNVMDQICLFQYLRYSLCGDLYNRIWRAGTRPWLVL